MGNTFWGGDEKGGWRGWHCNHNDAIKEDRFSYAAHLGDFSPISSLTNVLDHHEERTSLRKGKFLLSPTLGNMRVPEGIKICPVQWGPQRLQNQGELDSGVERTEVIRLIYILWCELCLPPFNHPFTSQTFCYHGKDPLFNTWTTMRSQSFSKKTNVANSN